MSTIGEKSLEMHYRWKGKIEIASRTTADTKEALSLAYTPGVAQPCLEIQRDIARSYDLTRRWNTQNLCEVPKDHRSLWKFLLTPCGTLGTSAASLSLQGS